MKSFKITSKHGMFLLILFFCSLSSLSAQIEVRDRQYIDNERGYSRYFTPASYQFEQQFAIPSSLPPLSTDMPYDVMLGYIYLDSLLKNTTYEEVYKSCWNRWINEESKEMNDTLKYAFQYLYKLMDYDPIRFVQFHDNMDMKYYTMSPMSISGQLSRVLNSKTPNLRKKTSFGLIHKSQHILHVKVIDVYRIPYRWYMSDTIDYNKYLYNISAVVIDTIKGQTFKPVETNMLKINIKDEKKLALIGSSNPAISFRHTNGPYCNDEFPFKTDPDLLDMNGDLLLQSGQELIVFLTYGNRLVDEQNDYYGLDLITVYPVIDGKVRDITHIWSDNDLIDYEDWFKIYNEKKALLFKGEVK